MKPLYTLSISAMLLLLASCSKDFSYEGGYLPEPPATDTTPLTPPVVDTPAIDTPPVILTDAQRLKLLLMSGDFQPRAFYSNIPIDYITTDAVVKQETDLWMYVAAWLKDDTDHFTETSVIVTQHSVKHPSLTDSLVTRPYLIGEDENGLYLEFLDYLYDALTYRVSEIGDDYFILAVPGPQGSTLYSRFVRI